MLFSSDENVRASDDIREELQPYILSQYSNSPTICRLLGSLRTKADAQPDLEGFFDTLFSLERVGEYGMDVWGRILNISRTFTDAETGERHTVSGNAYKQLLWLKAAANVASGDIGTLRELINSAINAVDGDSSADALYAINRTTAETLPNGETYNANAMHIQITIDGEIDDDTRAVILYLLPFILAAGVWYGLLMVDSSSVFGFNGSGLQPFDQGVFVADDAMIQVGG